MTYSSTQFSTSRRMSVYDTLHQVSMWEDSFNADSSHATTVSTIVEAKIDNKLGGSSHEMLEPSRSYDQESSKPTEKMLRRLAQNREAARKSRLRKKAYVHQLETSRLKLTQVEQELQRARQQGAYVGGGLDICHSGASATINPGIAKFEMEYEHWVEEQNRLIAELRNALQAHEIELRMFVDSSIKHYYKLFRMKAAVAKDDVIYLMSGMWKTSSERFFMWIGGFRPTIILKVLIPQLEPYAEQQFADVCNLQTSCQQFEDALSQGMDRLQLTLAETLAPDQSVTGSYMSQMTASMEKLEALVRFVNQADNLRQQTMQQMSRILTPRQAARALLALGDYMHRLRALSSLWAARPREEEICKHAIYEM